MAIDDHRCINIHRGLFWPVHPIATRRCTAMPRVSTKSFIPASLRRSTKVWPSPEAGLAGQVSWQGFMVKHGKHVEQFWKNVG